MMDRLGDIGAWFAGVTGGIVALWVGVKSVYKMGSRINRILKLVETELRANDGTSMKDIVVSTKTRVVALETTMDSCLLRLRTLDGGPGPGRRKYDEPEGATV